MSTGSFKSARRTVSEAGRQVLAAAVSIDHDWALRFSGEDMLIEAVSGLSDADLEGAYLLTHYLHEAVGCIQIRRETAKLPPAPADVALGVAIGVAGRLDDEARS